MRKRTRISEKDARLAAITAQLTERSARLDECVYRLNRINAWGWFRLPDVSIKKRLNNSKNAGVIACTSFEMVADEHRDSVEARSIDIDHSLAIPFGYVVKPKAAPGPVAAILNIFYEDLAVDLRSYLRNIPGEVDVFIATPDADRKLVIERAFASWASGRVEVRVMPNRGGDIAPKLIGLRDVYDRYDFVLHLHSKRSDHTSVWVHWRHYLLETLVGSPLTISSIFEAFERNSRLGMVAAQHFEPVRHSIHWGYNLDLARHLAARMGISIDPGTVLDFPSGSMFGARSAALRPLLDVELTTEELLEDGQRDGTLAHEVERIYFHVCERAGFDWIKIARPELMADTPAVVEVRDENELDRFFQQRVFRLHNPQGVLPRIAPPTPLEKPAARLLDALRDRVLGAGLPIAPHTRVAIGFVTSDSEAFSLRHATNAALLSLKYAGLPVHRGLWLLDNGESSESVVPQDARIVRLPRGGEVGFGAGHNRLMQAAFAEGATVYVAVDPDGILNPDAVGALVRMVQAHESRALVEALQLPIDDPKPTIQLRRTDLGSREPALPCRVAPSKNSMASTKGSSCSARTWICRGEPGPPALHSRSVRPRNFCALLPTGK